MNLNELIKVLNSQKAKELESCGFITYTTEKLNGKDVFVFPKTPELVSYLEGHFEKSDFFYSKKLHF